jgi:hypothetical protein
MAVDWKVISPLVSASKKSAERRWSSRASSLVEIEAVLTRPKARLVERSSAISNVPSNSLNSPRTVAMPRCLTAKPTLEWAGSTVQVPVGAMVAVLMAASRGVAQVAC